MKMLECILRPEKFDEVKNELGKFGIKGITVTNVIGKGKQLGKTELYRGNSYVVNLLPRIKLEIALADEILNDVINIILEKARTGETGDGKIFIYELKDAVRIRTAEKGIDAI